MRRAKVAIQDHVVALDVAVIIEADQATSIGQQGPRSHSECARIKNLLRRRDRDLWRDVDRDLGDLRTRKSAN